ncbi:putative gustatory receptor 98a [Zeugodacus cucurbitae]|uniref:putative gustatory receptor 98a n=1 Tax=Zeugodacus cucurbitae TaxID=28588 RepID=UPI0023D8F7BB|nr:putative gustatory receptor 98a [Zeugodacus cucurbitae]
MPQLERPIFQVSLQLFKRIMVIMGITPYTKHCSSQPGMSCRKGFILSLHLLAVFALTGILINEYLKSAQEAIYNVKDVFSSVIDGLGFSTLILVQLIIHLESTCKAHMYTEIFSKFAQMQKLLLQKFAIHFDLSRLKFCVHMLQIHFTIYCGLLIALVIKMLFEPGSVSQLLLTLHAELVLKVKLFEFMCFIIVFMVMICTVCKAAKIHCKRLEATRFENGLQRRECLLGFVALQDLHALLWENVQLLTDYFEWSLPGLFAKQLIDLTLLAYWAVLNIETGTSVVVKYYLIIIWIMQITTLTTACFLCSVCERKDREIRSYLRTCLKDRQNLLLMRCMHRITMQLCQEAITFVAGNFVTINIGTLGKN